MQRYSDSHPSSGPRQAPQGRRRLSLVIDCDTCVARHTAACDDCVMTHLVRDESEAVVIDLAEVRALRLLGDGGLVPKLRHQADAT